MNPLIPTRRAASGVLMALLAAVGLGMSPAQAQSGAAPIVGVPAFPTKPLRWIVAYPPGGGSDFLARTLAKPMSEQLGQPIVIDNRPGAATIVGTDIAAKSPADGYTLLSGDNGALVFNSALYAKLPYAVSDFAPVGLMARFPLVLVVNPASGITDAKDLIAKVKAAPGKYSFASPGAGSPHHLAMELLKERAGLFAVHVPYRGAALAITDVIGGQLPMMMVDTAVGLPHIRSGKVKPIAVASKNRLAQLPDVPTLAELGYKDIDVYAWQGLMVPKATPANTVARLSDALLKSAAQPEVRKTLTDFGLEVVASDAALLSGYIAAETVFWHKLIKDRGLKLE
jgi:tripartite-type tricarboxylate transporter receptor subunit TctC